MAEIIDLTLVADARRYFQKLLDTRGITYFLRKEGNRPFQIEASKVEMVIRTAARGLRTAREAVAAHLSSGGRTVHADALMLTASTSEAYSYVFKLLCDPGDEVLAFTPSYPLFEYLTTLESVRLSTSSLVAEADW